MPESIHAPWSRLAASVLACVSALAAAAPVGTSDDPAGSGSEIAAGAGLPTAPGLGRDATGGTRLPDRASLPEVPSTSKTIDLLLEMQGRNPGLAGGERPQNSEMPSPRSRQAPAAVDTQPFGSDSAPRFAGPQTPPAPAVVPVKPETPAIDWTNGAARTTGTIGWGGGGPQPSGMMEPGRMGAREPGAADDASQPRWLLIPRSVVRFVRENRDMVIGASVAVLLALWAATTFASGRRK